MPTARTAQRNELAEVLELYRMLNPDDPRVDRDEDLEQLWEDMCEDETQDIVVIDHDGRLVATCLLSSTRNLSRGARPFAVIENVVTHEKYRGQGFWRGTGTATRSCS